MSMLTKVVRTSEAQARRLLAGSEPADALLHGSSLPEVDLDKAWHVLHFVLAGDIGGGDGPAGFLLDGGEPVGEDGGYGPARLFMPDEVAAIDSELQRVSEADIHAIEGREEMDSLYGGWEGPLRSDEFGYYAEHLAALKAFVRDSVGSAILVDLY